MSNVYANHLSTPTPQSEKENSLQVKNSAGGFTFTVTDKVRLERFLILGTENGTYYTNEKKITKENFEFLKALIERDEAMVIEVVRDVSVNGRAFKNTQAILTVAALFVYGKIKPRSLMHEVCRTGTHLFEFAEFVELLGGWGPAKRKAVAEWYRNKTPDNLAYQVVKYRQRNGWTHRDLFRLTHPQGSFTPGIGEFLLNKPYDGVNHELIVGFKLIQSMETISGVLATLDTHPNLPWEAIPTHFHKEPKVWRKLFYNGQLKGQALVRNITRLARIGAFDDMVFARDYANKLVDEDMIKYTRLHPMNYLQALHVHEVGQIWRPKKLGDRVPANAKYINGAHRVKDWTTSPVIKDALNAGFYLAFKYVEPSNKRTFIGLDVSGSMSNEMSGLDMSCAMTVAAMAMATAKTEPYYQIYGFSDGTNYRRSVYYGSSSYEREVLSDLGISPNMDLNTVMRKTADLNFGRTDCALPMKWALRNKVEVDTFAIYTDNETWFGGIHPHKALEKYRQGMGIDAKLVVVACTPTEFTIADPRDRGMLDIVGADSNLPKLISEFSAGRI